ncbi:MAG: WG repeat-containing protein [Muribaculaceae bacterium]|nr:WG repeat-containing protein [Muribaculaceae bacterium]
MKQTMKSKRKHGKYGYVDENDKWVVEPVYQVAWDFKEGFGRVKIPPRISGKYGFIKPGGSFLIEPILEKARDFKEGLAAIKIKGKWTFLKPDGSFLTEPIFDKVWDFHLGIAITKEGDNYRFLLPDGTFKEINRTEQYVIDCYINQNTECSGWSFLEPTCSDGKWYFKSWSRQMDENQKWYDVKITDETEFIPMLRYTDIIQENNSFACWASSLKLSTSAEIGELLWANVYQLLLESKDEQKQGRYIAPLRDIVVMIQLYNQLKVIENLGLSKFQTKFPFTSEDKKLLDSDQIKKRGIEMCNREMMFDEDGFIDLDFNEFIEKSRTPGRFDHFTDLELFDIET